ncbi:hypothetical protein RK59_018920 [Shigella flexneri]|nr:hypothetical protein RK59_018920 [Shigella flexneri]
MTDFGGKTSIFSHPVYLFLRKFSLQDSRGGSNRPLTDFGGKTSIFSHPVYLFLREFSLQDSRGGSPPTTGLSGFRVMDECAASSGPATNFSVCCNVPS